MKISIVTATYNCVDTISDCLDSIVSQSHRDREHLVIDGVSRDGTLELLRSRCGEIATLVSEPDVGIYDALNKGIALANGEVLGFLHADDFYSDDKVLERVAAAFADPEVEAVYGDLVYVARRNTNRVIRYWRSGSFRHERLRKGWMPPHPTLYLRRSLYERFGAFDISYSIAADYDLMLRMLTQLQGRVVYLPQVLVRMRVGGVSNRSVRTIAAKSWEDYRVLRTHGIGGLRVLAWKNFSKLLQFVRLG